MWRAIAVLFASTLLTIGASTNSNADDAYIVPEQLQQLAAKENVAAHLGIKWEAANPTDVGRYMGTLAAADIVAKTIAAKNGRTEPTREDYLAGLSSLCYWPPNKRPVLTSEDRQRLYPAFYSNRLRESIPGAVGQSASRLPALISQKPPEAVNAAFPENRDDYFKSLFNPNALR
jgi:hypothetical protein